MQAEMIKTAAAASGGHPFGEYLSVVDLAAYTGISASTWNKRRLTGDTPPFSKLGKTVRYRRADVDAWMSARQIGSTAETPHAA